MIKILAYGILLFWLLAVVLGRLFQLDPNQIDLNAILNTPSAVYWLGNDDLGRSILARLLHGVEVSLLVALSVTAVTMTVGVLIGLLAGFYGGRVDQVLMCHRCVFGFPWDFISHCFCRGIGPGFAEFNDRA